MTTSTHTSTTLASTTASIIAVINAGNAVRVGAFTYVVTHCTNGKVKTTMAWESGTGRVFHADIAAAASFIAGRHAARALVGAV